MWAAFCQPFCTTLGVYPSFLMGGQQSIESKNNTLINKQLKSHKSVLLNEYKVLMLGTVL
jgi:hypothetical protein